MAGSSGLVEAGGLPVIVVGAGMAGIACARRLHDAGLLVRVLERGHRPGGRMAVRTERRLAATESSIGDRPAIGDGPSSGVCVEHVVDLGAPYFTVSDPGFAVVVEGWQVAGLARPWTDRFAKATATPGHGGGDDGGGGLTGVISGPQRWSTSHGMRSLVEALAVGLDVRLEHDVQRVEPGAERTPLVDGEPARAVVLAMPDPQAARLLPEPVAAGLGVVDRGWAPVITVWAAWPVQQRWWPVFDGVFVAGSDVISWVADSGRSRGDGAPVLVVHTVPGFAERHLDDPAAAIGPVLAELSAVLGGSLPVPDAAWSRAHRWSFARTGDPHAEPWAFEATSSIGVCGDAWGPRSRVEQAWLSGTGLAQALLERLAVTWSGPQA